MPPAKILSANHLRGRPLATAFIQVPIAASSDNYTLHMQHIVVLILLGGGLVLVSGRSRRV